MTDSIHSLLDCTALRVLAVLCATCTACATYPCHPPLAFEDSRTPLRPITWEQLPEAPEESQVAPAVLPSVSRTQDQRNGELRPERTYRVITLNQVFQAASAHAAVANVLEREAQWRADRVADRRNRCSTLLESVILRLAAQKQRQKAAAEALRAFWNLAEAEQGRKWLLDSKQYIGKLLSQVELLRQEGHAGELQRIELVEEDLKISSELQQLEAAIEQLNRQLSMFTGMELPPGGRLWPDADWKIIPMRVEVEDAINRAWELRVELQQLQTLLDYVDTAEVNVVRRLLSPEVPWLEPMLPVARRWTVAWHRADQETLLVRQVIERLLDERRRVVAEEVKGGVAAVGAAFEAAHIADQRYQLAVRKRAFTHEAFRAGRATLKEHLQAELELRQQHGELLRRVADYQRAVLAWHEVMGDLAEHVNVEPQSHAAIPP